MSYSRRQLEAFGEPFGDSATRKEAGRIVYGGGGGGGSGSSTQITDLPDWAKPYAQQTMEYTRGLTAPPVYKKDASGQNVKDESGKPILLSGTPYQTYDAERFAGFGDLQKRAQETVAGMGPSGQLGTGTGLATAAGLMGLGASYQPGYFGNQFRAPQQYQPSQFGMMSAQAPDLQQFQMGPAERVSGGDYNAPQMAALQEMGQAAQVQGGQYAAPEMRTAQTGFRPDLQTFQMGPAAQVQGGQYYAPEMRTAQTAFRPDLQQYQMGPAERAETQSFTQPGSAEAYMNPFMQNVVDKQVREAERQAGLAAKQQRAQSIQRGAFGGGRSRVAEEVAARDLAQLKSDIYGTGQQAAFQNAQQQFNAEQQARMQAQLANQQAGLTVGGQNLSARLGVQQLGAQTGLQSALANLSAEQQANVQNQAAQLQTQGLNAQQAMQAALANQQAGLTVGQQNLAAQQATQQLGTQTGLQAALANLSSEQQANVQNQAAQLQTQGLNAQQAMQAALANQQAGLTTGQQNLAARLTRDQQNLASQLQTQGLTANQAMQAALANQQAGLTTGQQNLNALLGVQQLGSGQNMQAQIANQQAYQNMLAQREASRQFGYGQQMTAAQQRAQFGQAANQLAEQSRQFGAGYGQQGLNTALQAAGQLGNLGQAEFGQRKDIVGLQSQLGAQEQALRQQGLTQAYQDFLNEQNYPYRQLGFMSDMIRGLPLGQQTTRQVYEPPGSALGQIAGLGVGLGGMARFGQMFPGGASGGEVKEYADGGSVTSNYKVDSILNTLSDVQLQQARAAAVNSQDQRRLEMIDEELAERASLRSGLGSAFNALPEETQEAVTEMASGGIVAFAGPTEDNNYSLVQDPQFGAGLSAEALSGDRARVEALKARRAAEEERKRLEFLRTAAPEVYERRMAERPTASAAPPAASAASRQEPARTVPSAPARREISLPPARPSRSESSSTVTRQNATEAVQTIANAAKIEIPKDETQTLAKTLFEELMSKSDSERKEFKAELENAKNRAKEIEARGIGEAMMKFGFGMAAAASKPGRRQGLAGVLESAATASPLLSESLAENTKLQQAAQDNYTKLRMENARYQSALEQGNMQLAANIAAGISQRKLTEADLQQKIAQSERAANLDQQKLGLEERRLAIAQSQAGRPSSSLELAYNIISRDPKNANKSPTELVELAAKSAAAASTYRADQSAELNRAALVEKVKKANPMYGVLEAQLSLAKTPEDQAAIRRKLEEIEKRALGSIIGGGGVGSRQNSGWSIEPVAGAR